MSPTELQTLPVLPARQNSWRSDITHAFAQTHGWAHPTDVQVLVVILDRPAAAPLAGTPSRERQPVTPGTPRAHLGPTWGVVSACPNRQERPGHMRRFREASDKRVVHLSHEPRARPRPSVLARATAPHVRRSTTRNRRSSIPSPSALPAVKGSPTGTTPPVPRGPPRPRPARSAVTTCGAGTGSRGPSRRTASSHYGSRSPWRSVSIRAKGRTRVGEGGAPVVRRAASPSEAAAASCPRRSPRRRAGTGGEQPVVAGRAVVGLQCRDQVQSRGRAVDHGAAW